MHTLPPHLVLLAAAFSAACGQSSQDLAQDYHTMLGGLLSHCPLGLCTESARPLRRVGRLESDITIVT